jgi:hypothetical protein
MLHWRTRSHDTRTDWPSVSMPHGVISQQTERFVSTGVRTLNPTVRKKFNGNLSVLQLLRWTRVVNWYAETVTWIRTLLFCSNCPHKSCYPYLLLHDISEYPSCTNICDGFRISIGWNPLRLTWILFYSTNSPWQYLSWQHLSDLNIYKQNKLRGLSPRANCTDRATAACRRS